MLNNAVMLTGFVFLIFKSSITCHSGINEICKCLFSQCSKVELTVWTKTGF